MNNIEQEVENLKARVKQLEGDGAVVAVVLDKSGSMQAKRKVAMDGFNQFLTRNKEAVPNATFVYTLFDTTPKPTEVAPIKDVKRLTKGKYIPGGMTALYDAIGQTLERLETMNAKRVAVAIVTDGMENQSTEYSRDKILKKIKKAQNRDWQFTFIGADIDAYEVGASIGLRADQTLSVHGVHGTVAAMDISSIATSNYLRGNTSSVTYTAADKKKAEKEPTPFNN